MRQNAIPMRMKSADHATGNAQFGGLKDGFASVLYQSATGAAEMSRPAVEVIATLSAARQALRRGGRVPLAARQSRGITRSPKRNACLRYGFHCA